MQKLFESWRSFQTNLTEGMKQPEQLPDDVFVLINSENAPEVIKISYVDNTGKDIINGPVSGNILIAKSKGGKCLNAWVVKLSVVSKGWGPLLYDTALEWTSANGGGLTADRDSVSEEAYAVWKYYLDNRNDVEKIQLDDLRNTLTPTDIDNCEQGSSEEYADELGIKWSETALSKLYRKQKADIIPKLKNLKKLIDSANQVNEERVVGGLADYMSDEEFDQEQLRLGIKVEYEHTNDYEVAKEIAKDHLKEDPKYYQHLLKLGL